jgi:hypothetical protein
MSMPGFAAEAALYRTSKSYAARQYRPIPSNVSAISPQACGAWKGLLCNGLIAGCIPCALLVNSPPAMIACFAGCLGGWYAYCGECIDVIDIPDNGNGGGGRWWQSSRRHLLSQQML